MVQERVSLTGGGAVDPAASQPYVPPAESVPLPSKGRAYGPEHPLHAAERVDVYAMTSRGEDILTSRALLKQGKAVDVLVRSCLCDKRIDPDSLLVGDKNAVTVAVRVTGYGASYETTVRCPTCDRSRKWTFDLAGLEVKPLGDDPLEPFVNRFGAVTASGRAAEFKLLTGADEKEISDAIERGRKVAGPDAVDPNVTMRLFHQLVSLDGDSDRKRISREVQRLSPRDSLSLRRRIAEVEPGVRMRQRFECEDPDCDAAAGTEVGVPLGPEFFWPEA